MIAGSGPAGLPSSYQCCSPTPGQRRRQRLSSRQTSPPIHCLFLPSLSVSPARPSTLSAPVPSLEAARRSDSSAQPGEPSVGRAASRAQEGNRPPGPQGVRLQPSHPSLPQRATPPPPHPHPHPLARGGGALALDDDFSPEGTWRGGRVNGGRAEQGRGRKRGSDRQKRPSLAGCLAAPRASPFAQRPGRALNGGPNVQAWGERERLREGTARNWFRGFFLLFPRSLARPPARPLSLPSHPQLRNEKTPLRRGDPTAPRGRIEEEGACPWSHGRAARA